MNKETGTSSLPALRRPSHIRRIPMNRADGRNAPSVPAAHPREHLSEVLNAFEKHIEDTLSFLKKEVRKPLGKKRAPAREKETFEAHLERLLKDFEERVDSILGHALKKEEPRIITGIGALLGRLRNFSPSMTYTRRFRDLTMWVTSAEVDEFGLDVGFEEKLRPLFEFFYRTWWRVETQGIDNVPHGGRVLLVANHGGTLPFDGGMIKLALLDEHPAQREVRPLVEDFVFFFPFLGTFMQKIGGVRACQENAQRLLEKDQAVVVFPEGVKGVGKLYKERYQLQRFGRGGFISLCIKTRSPLVPVAVVGAEEIYPLIYRSEWLGRLIGAPYFPITPFWPWLGPLGMVPLPSKWTIRFGEPMDFSDFPPEALEDDILINHLSNKVRSTIQDMIIELLRKRKNPWFG